MLLVNPTRISQSFAALRRHQKYTVKAPLLPSALLLLAGCEPGENTVSFLEGIHQYDTAQTVEVRLPQGASDIYVTTDNNDPIPREQCRLTNPVISVEKPTVIKVRFTLDGNTLTQTGIYVIADAITESRYGNRVAIDLFENFIRSHINPAFGPSPTIFDQNLSINDGMGGTATRDTVIEGIIFKSGKQTFSFDNYSYYEPNDNTLFIAESGSIFGYRDSDGGYYNTDEDGERIVYSGTFNGSADGHFYLDSEGYTTRGFYRVNCVDRWCADGDVIYAMDRQREYVEIFPSSNDDTISCE